MSEHVRREPRRTRVWILIAACTAVLVALVGSGAASAAHYDERALPRTSVAAIPVSGMTHDEVVAAINERAQNIRVTARVDGKETEIALADAGIQIDAEATATLALESSRSWTSRLQGLFTSRQIPVVTTTDEEALSAMAETLARQAGPAAVDASAHYDADRDAFVVDPAENGTTIDAQALTTALMDAATTLGDTEVDLSSTQSEPSVTTEAAQQAAQQADEMLEPDVSLTDTIDSFTPSRADVAQWISFENTDSKLTAHYSSKAVGSWVSATAQASNVEADPTINNVNAAGDVLVEAWPGKPGLKANNVADLSNALMSALDNGETYEGTITYDDVPQETKTRPIAPGAENLPYPAAEGEKWIDIDLTRLTVTPYIGTKQAHEPISIVPGSPGHETVTGLYHVYLKYEKQDMGCTPEWPYCAKGVPWVSYFTGSYAMHGAPWVSEFGWSGPGGSHGCLNMPVWGAKLIYDFDEIGTPVMSHY